MVRCDNCGRSNGFMVHYYKCPRGGIVCGKCFKFGGKCKLCGANVKNHTRIK